MKEKDIRERIHIFLRDTVRYVVVPASMGIGLALVGCSDSGLDSNPDSSADTAPVQSGAGSSTETGSATNSTDTGTGTNTMTGTVAVYSAPMQDGAVSSGTGTGSATDTGTGTGTGSDVVRLPDAGTTGTRTGISTLTGMLYMAVMPDAGASDTATRTYTNTVAVYMAPQPDAASVDASKPGTDAGLITKYMAAMPDAGQKDFGAVVVPLYGTPMRYMAVMPPEAGMPLPQPDYMAVFPLPRDAGSGPVLLYMAPMPTKH
jgi:hypothetical protein